VIDGSEAFVGSDRAQAGRALAKEVNVPRVSVKIGSVHFEQGKALAQVEIGPVPAKAEVFVAIALDHAQSQVLRGENGGRKLEHVAIVERLVSIGKLKKDEPLSKDVAIKIDHPEQNYRVVAFVQQGAGGKILGAVVAHVK